MGRWISFGGPHSLFPGSLKVSRLGPGERALRTISSQVRWVSKKKKKKRAQSLRLPKSMLTLSWKILPYFGEGGEHR